MTHRQKKRGGIGWVSNTIDVLFKRTQQNASRRRRHTRRLQLCEALEDRRMLATFAVVNLNDAGVGSLRQAVADANAMVGADVIDMTGVSGTITLTSGQLELTDVRWRSVVSLDLVAAPWLRMPPQRGRSYR